MAGMPHFPELRMVFDPALAPGDPLGLWQAGPAQMDEIGRPPEITSWQVALPTGQKRAKKQLQHSAVRLRCAQAALPQAEARLKNFTQALPYKGLEYALPSGEAYTAERELQDFLARTQRTGARTYGLDDMFPKVRELVQSVSQLAHNVRLSLASQAQVETSQAGRLVGRSWVSWSGDITSEWMAELSVDQADLHHDAVAQILDTRQSWVRITLFLAGGSAALTASLSGNPLAFLGVYQFVKQVIAEFQNLVSGAVGENPNLSVISPAS
jgi:hypothetical protein